MFLSRLRVLSFSSPRVLIKTTLYVCGGGFFLSLTKNSSKRQKHKTFFRSPHSFFVWFGTLFTLRCLFLFDHPVDVNKGTISFRVRLVSPCCDRRKTSPRSRGERGGKIIYSFCAPKKESSFLPPFLLLLVLLLLLSCDLFFFITTYELYRRSLGFFSFVLLLPSRGSNRRVVVVVGRSRLLSLFLLLSFTHTRSLSSLLKNRHLLEASIDHFSKQKTHNFFE